MVWNELVTKVEKAVDVFIKADGHAFALILIGCVLKLKHIDDPGLMLAGLAIFKGRT